MNRASFVGLAIVLICLAIVRSAISTRLDSFTEDEAYHIAAGVTYVKYRDFRINPEHPPLVKLWVGAVINAAGFRIEPFRRFNDKPDERDYTESAVFLQNDPDSVQRRARIAMWFLNGVLLLALALAAERTFSAAAALGTLIFLVIDPTVAAHLPVVMTDLPVALASATGILLAVRVFRDWLWSDVLICSAFLGVALATKHSAPVALIGVTVAGICSVWLKRAPARDVSRISRFLKLGVMLAGGLFVLWGFYGFRYDEGRKAEESFNRPLALKIADIESSVYRTILTTMSRTRVVPRAYLWGFADTIRAGMEGRMIPQLAFGKFYERKAPWYFFPGAIAAKLPLGLALLSILGISLYMAGYLSSEWKFAGTILLVTMTIFLVVLSRGATYGGVRHALPVVVLLAVFGGIAEAFAIRSSSVAIKLVVVLALLAAGVSAIPVMRPWEYFNELAGGPRNAYKYFSDDGIDIGQRTKELARYYQQHRDAIQDPPELLYLSSPVELKARGVDYLGRDMSRDYAKAARPERVGTAFVGPLFLIPKPYWDRASLRDAKPVARFGNLLIYSGSFNLPGNAALVLYYYGLSKLFTEKPDLLEGERALRDAAKLDPAAYFVNIELANVLVLKGEREPALQAYRDALQHVRGDAVTRRALERQIEQVQDHDLKSITPVRDPQLE